MNSEMTRGMVGAHNELLATVWLLKAGYQVFRNVSAHGPIDLIALKDGAFEYFDVKMAYERKRGHETKIRVTPEQAKLNVKILRVYPDGSCDIDDSPFVNGEVISYAAKVCRRCGTSFSPRHFNQFLCSEECTSEKIRYAARSEARD